VSDPTSGESGTRPRDNAPTRGRTPVLLRVVFVGMLAFTMLGVVESAFIVYDLFTGSLSEQRAPDLELGIRSWTVHHAMRPGYSNPAVHTNSFGLRSPEVAVPKPAGIFRILLLGDSFTFGFQASDADVFARKMEQRLRTDYEFTSVEVVNAGVLSYCPLLEYLQYRHHLHVLEPDLVVLNFDMSDVQDHLDYSRDAVFSSDGLPLFVTQPSLRKSPTAMPGLLSFEWVARHFNAATRRFQSAVEGVPFMRDQDRYLWALDNGPELDREVQSTLAPIADLNNLLKHDHIPLLLATYPQPWQVSADATPLPPIRDQFGIGNNTVHLNDRSFRKLETFAAKQGIPFVSAVKAFREHPNPARLFLQRDFHFTPLGHDVYAEVLVSDIVRRGFVRSLSGLPSER
jgi:hypothetical protein